MDICKRNGKKKLIWLSDKDKSLAYDPKSGEMVLTVHRLYHLGHIKEPLRESSLSVSKIIEVFLSFDDIKIQNRAFSIGEMIQNENGVERAVRFLENLVLNDISQE